MNVRKANITHIENISVLHKKVFDNSYFSVHYSLKLLNKYFESLLSANEYNYVVIDDDNKVIGFLIGGYKTQSAVDNFMKKNIRDVIICTIKYPKFIFIGIGKIIRRIFFKEKITKAKLRLFLIGINPDSGNRGAGSLLISKFEEELLKNNIHQYGLYVRSDNTNAIKFYEHRRFEYEYKKHNLIAYIKTI